MELKKVSFELAKKIKDIGFRKIYGINHCYSIISDEIICCTIDDLVTVPVKEVCNGELYLAPTLELAKQWFREEHNIIIEIGVRHYTDNKIGWDYEIYANNEWVDEDNINKFEFYNEELNTYEKALETALFYACGILEK